MAAGQADLLLDARLDSALLGEQPAEAVQRDKGGHVGLPLGEEVVLDGLGAVLVPVLVGDSWP